MPENTGEDPDDPEPTEKGDIQMEYYSDQLYSPSKEAVAKNYLQDLRPVWVPPDNPEFSICLVPCK
jgi:hypothetical protein